MTERKSELSETALDRVAVKIEQRSPRSRWIEDGLAIAGIAQAMLYGTLEALRHNGISFGKCEPTSGVPWITIVIFVGCVLPKTLGRATAGKVWEKLPIVGGK